MKGILTLSTLVLNLVALFVCLAAGVSGWSWLGAHLLSCLLAFVVSYLIWSNGESIRHASINNSPLILGEDDEKYH